MRGTPPLPPTTPQPRRGLAAGPRCRAQTCPGRPPSRSPAPPPAAPPPLGRAPAPRYLLRLRLLAGPGSAPPATERQGRRSAHSLPCPAALRPVRAQPPPPSDNRPSAPAAVNFLPCPGRPVRRRPRSLLARARITAPGQPPRKQRGPSARDVCLRLWPPRLCSGGARRRPLHFPAEPASPLLRTTAAALWVSEFGCLKRM